MSFRTGRSLQPVGIYGNLTPWSDWTNAGVTTSPAPAGISGNYASIPFFGDLFQQFAGPAPGAYTLSFLVQNPMPYAAQMTTSLQQPGGGGWHDFQKASDLAPSSDFVRETFNIDWTRPAGTPSEFYFANSYDAPNPARGFENSINPVQTILNVADVSFTPFVPTPPPTSKFELKLFNVDDQMTASISNSAFTNQVVADDPFGQTYPKTDLSSFVRPGLNTLTLALNNTIAGYSYGYDFTIDGQTYASGQCGIFNTYGCNADSYQKGLVWTTDIKFNGDGLFHLPPTSDVPEPATWAMLIVGFGLTGASLRRRNRLNPAVA